MPVQGYTRYRSTQVGKQTVIGTAVAATRRLPMRGPLVINPNWEDPDVDAGSLDPILPPFRTGTDVTASQTGPLAYNDAQIYWAAALVGGVTSTTVSGIARSSVFVAASTTVDPFEYYTMEWGDDVTTDYSRGTGGVIETLSLEYPENLGPVQASVDWRFAAGETGTISSVPTTGLVLNSNLAWVYAADTEFYINDTAGAIGTTKISDQFHGGTITVTNELDLKRYANGSNTRFAIGGYGRANRTIEAEFRFAKQANSIAETALWNGTDATLRFVEIKTTSPTLITGTTPYSHSVRIAGDWRTRTDEDQGGNSIIVLSLKGRYSATLTYAIRAAVVNSVAV